MTYSDPNRPLRFTLLLAIVFTASLFVACLASGQEVTAPKPVMVEPDGGGYFHGVPSWLVEVKSSESPLRRGGKYTTFSGTGFWVSSDLVLTCWHNYRDTIGKPRWSESIIDHTGHEYKDVTVLAKHADADLMLVRVKDVKPRSHGQLVISSDDHGFGPYYAIGWDFDLAKVKWVRGDNYLDPTGGCAVSGTDPQHVYWFITTCPIILGMSGGPTFDMSNEVVGVNIRSNTDRKKIEDSYSVMVDLPTIQKFLDTVDVGD